VASARAAARGIRAAARWAPAAWRMRLVVGAGWGGAGDGGGGEIEEAMEVEKGKCGCLCLPVRGRLRPYAVRAPASACVVVRRESDKGKRKSRGGRGGQARASQSK
jgi:hypothetical protein